MSSPNNMANPISSLSLSNLSLKTKLAAYVWVWCFIVIFLLAKKFGDDLHDDFKEVLSGQQLASTSYVAESIGSAIALRSDVLRKIAAEIKPEMLADPRAVLLEVQKRASVSRLFPGNMFVISDDGKILADLPPLPGRIGKSVAHRGYFIAAVKTGELVLGDPHETNTHKRPVVMWAVPLKDREGQLSAVLAASDLLTDSELFAQITPRSSRGLGDIHVISAQDRIVVASTNKSLILKPTDSADLKALYDRFKGGREGSDVLAGGGGVQVLASGKGVANTEWMVVSTLPAADAFAPISDNIRHVYLTAGFGSFVLALLIWVVVHWELEPLSTARRMINDISRGLEPLHPLPEIGGREIRQWLRSFNRLQERMSEKEKQLRASEERWKFALEGSHDGVWDRDLETGKVTYSNSYREMYGFSEDELRDEQEPWYARVHPDDIPAVEASRAAYFAGKSDVYISERRMQCKDGSWKWTLVRGMVVRRAADGQPTRMIGTHTDISGQKQMEWELRNLATTDSLTGLPNRRHFLSRLDEEFARLQRGMVGNVAVLMIDLDSFKRINDLHGHAVGDRVLRHFAGMLHDGLRKVDADGRLGGEEFGVLLAGAATDDALVFAERLRHKVAEFPLEEQGKPVPLTVSIGIAQMNRDDPSGEVALSRADHALYRAKNSGRNQVCCAAG